MTDYDVQLKAGARRSLEESISETWRELQVRERCYKRWIEDGKLSKTDAKDRLERLESAVQFLKYFQDWLAAEEHAAQQQKVTPIPSDRGSPATSHDKPLPGLSEVAGGLSVPKLARDLYADPPQTGGIQDSAQCG